MEVGPVTGTELARLSEALRQSKQPVRTPPFEYIRKLINRNMSAIVTIPDGDGKTTFLEDMERSGEFIERDGEEEEDCEASSKEMGTNCISPAPVPAPTLEYIETLSFEEEEDDEEEEDELPDWIALSNCLDGNSLALEIWECEGRPVPTLQEVEDKGRIGRYMTRQPHDGLICFYCSRECRLIKLEKSPFAAIFRDDDVGIGFTKIGAKLGGDCPVIKKGMFSNLLKSKFKENVVIEAPKSPSGEYLKILRTLQKNRQIIILCPPEAEETLHNTFPSLAVRKAPPIPINFLLVIYSQKLKDAGLTISPLSLSSLRALAVLNQANVERFLQAVSQLIDDMELEECQETVSDAYVFGHIRDKISDYVAIKIIIDELRRSKIKWVKAKNIHNMLLQEFNLEIGLERIGNLMKENFITKRRNPDAEYHIGAEVDEASTYLTEGTERTEGGLRGD